MLTTITAICSVVALGVQVGTLIAGGAALVNAPSIGGLAANLGVFDIPFVNGISYFVAGLGYAKVVAYLLAQLFCVMGIVWNAFKLWAGAEQVKKTCVQIGARLIIFSFLYTWYVSITMNLLVLGTGIGEMICGGKQKAEKMYSDVTTMIITQIEGYKAAEMSAFEIVKGRVLTEKQFSTLIGYMENAPTTPQAQAELQKRYGITLIDDRFEQKQTQESNEAYNTLNTLLKNKMALMRQSGNATITQEEIDAHPEWKMGEDYVREVVKKHDYTTGEDDEEEVFYKTSNLNVPYQNLTARLDALAKAVGLTATNKKTGKNETLKSGMLDSDMYTTNMEQYKQMIADWFKGLYLDFGGKQITYSFGNETKSKLIENEKKDAGGIFNMNPKYLSPGAIVKLGTLLGKMLSIGDDSRAFEKSKLGLLWSKVMQFALGLVQMFIVLFTCVILAIDYIIMILEFHIVTTISYIFLPLMLFDGTRQYAMKLLGTFMGFFVRILVFTVIFYFCIDTFMMMIFSQFSGLVEPTEAEGFSQITLSCFLCLMLAQKVPQIAQTILSGSPSMGAGDVARAAHGAMHGAMMGRNMAGRIAGASRAAGTAVGKSFGNSAVAAAGKKHAAQEAIAKAKAEGKTDEKELKAIGKQAGGSWLHSHGMSTGQRMSRFVGNLYSQAAFGIKDNYTDKEKLGGLGMGYGNSTNQKATLRDAMNSATGNGAQKDGGTKPSESQPSSEASKAAEQKPIGKAEGKAAVRAGDTGAKSPDYPETAQGGSSGMTGSGNGGAGSAAAAQKKPQPDSKRSSYTPPAQATQGGGSTQKPASNGVAKQQSGNTAQKPSGSRPKSSATPKHPQSGGKPYSRKSGNGRRK